MNSEWLPRSIEEVPELDERDYARFHQLLLERYGMFFSSNRHSELALGVRQAFAASNCASLDAYYRLLKDPKNGSIELNRLVNAVTISETHFFRNTPQFDALYTEVLPQLIAQHSQTRTLRIWSAGCASGEEAYSIAILLRELLPDVDRWAITILGTDINTEALDRARRALYGPWAFREPRAKRWRNRYFRQVGKRYALAPEVRRMVTFSYLNLAEETYPAYKTNTIAMDLILCRNVTIYFSKDVTEGVIGRFYDSLVDGGWLVVGHSEPSLSLYHLFQACNYSDTILYRRMGSAAADTPVIKTAAPSTLAQPMAQNLLERAHEYLEYGRTEEARDLLLELVKRRGSEAGDATLYAMIGQVYADLGQWHEAEEWCRRALAQDKLALRAYYTLALVLQHQGRCDQAIEALKKVIYLDRGHIPAHYGMAELYHRRGALGPALKSLENAQHLLETYNNDEVVPDSGGVTVGRLRAAIAQQQQRWRAETPIPVRPEAQVEPVAARGSV